MLSGKTFNGFRKLGGLRGPFNSARVVGAITKIRCDGVAEKQTLLRDETDFTTQLVHRDVPDWNSVDEYLALLWIMQTRDEIHERRLPAAGCSNNTERRPGDNVEAHVAKHPSWRIACRYWIVEPHVS